MPKMLSTGTPSASDACGLLLMAREIAAFLSASVRLNRVIVSWECFGLHGLC